MKIQFPNYSCDEASPFYHVARTTARTTCTRGTACRTAVTGRWRSNTVWNRAPTSSYRLSRTRNATASTTWESTPKKKSRLSTNIQYFVFSRLLETFEATLGHKIYIHAQVPVHFKKITRKLNPDHLVCNVLFFQGSRWTDRGNRGSYYTCTCIDSELAKCTTILLQSHTLHQLQYVATLYIYMYM